MKYFEVFKAGVYPQGKFTKKQIAEIASNYDPKFCEAPITIDHQQSGPAYGWVQDVKAENDKLKVCFKDVPEEFEQEVNAGKYKKDYFQQLVDNAETQKTNWWFRSSGC